MSVIVDIDHDDNTLGEYDSSTGVSVSVGARLAGSVAGLVVNISDLADRYGQFDFAQVTSDNIRVRFYVDPNTLTMGANEGFIMCLLMDGATTLGEVRLAYISSTYTIETRWKEDSTSFKDGPSGTITDAEHYVEVRFQRATGASNDDGIVELFIDGASEGSVTDFDVFTIAQPSRVRLGAADGVDAGTSGIFYLDELIVRDDDTEIGASTPPDPGTPPNVPSSDTTSNLNSLIPSFFQSKQISIAVFEPLISGGAFLYGDIADIARNYSHEIRANGGYWSAKFSLTGRKDYVDSWIDRGLGRHIEVYNHAQSMIWEGFVHKVSVSMAGDNISVGPLLDMGNKVSLSYSAFIQMDNGQGAQGIRLNTSTVEDTSSQARYGVIERKLSGGGIPTDEAENLRDAYLEENGLPRTSRSGSLGSTQAMVVNVECLGYIHFAKAYLYSNSTRSTQTIDAKIKAVLGADPNSYLSTDYSLIDVNSFTVPTYENGDRAAFDVLQALGELGGSNDERYAFGVYAGRRGKYASVPSEAAYHRAMFAGEMAFFTPSGQRVEPWDIRPGEWVFTTDVYGKGDKTDMKDDRRFTLIESVSYSLPTNLSWTGGRADRLPQRLARLGLSGIGS